jgi:formylglycine-generating enzyme required for sulfatase activity
MGTEDLDEVAFELPDGNLEPVRDETPAHRVTFPQAFLLGKTEVARGQWLAVMGTRPGPEAHWDRSDWPGIPVVSVTWYDAQSFAQRLSHRDPDAECLLPSEAQWEYAARAGTRGLRPVPLAEPPAQA